MVLFSLLKHFEHPVRHYKPAHHIQRPQHHRQKPQPKRNIIVALRLTHHDDRTDDDLPMNGIGATHQRRMQHRRHTAYYHDTQKYHQDDDIDHLLMDAKPGQYIIHVYRFLSNLSCRQTSHSISPQCLHSLIHHLPPMRDTTTLHQLILHIQSQLSLRINQQFQEIQHILPIQLTRIIRQGRCQSRIAHNRHPIPNQRLIVLRQLGITTRGRGQIDNDRPLPHSLDHLSRHQHRSGKTRYLGRRDHNIRPRNTLSNSLLLPLSEIYRLFHRITTRFGRIRSPVYFNKFSTQTHNLFLHRRPRIKYFDNGAQPPGRSNGLQPGYPCPQDQNSGRRDTAPTSHQHRELTGISSYCIPSTTSAPEINSSLDLICAPTLV